MSEWKDIQPIFPMRNMSLDMRPVLGRLRSNLVCRYRRSTVVACQFFADGLVTYFSVRIAELAAALTGSPVRHISALALITALTICFSCLGLYTGSGPSPFERFRLRFLGFLLITGALLIALLPSDNLTGVIAAAASFAVVILLAGFYADQLVRLVLVQCGLWNARTLIAGPESDARRLAQTLLQDDAGFGLRPVCFLFTGDVTAGARQDASLPQITDLQDIAAGDVEIAVFTSARDLAEKQMTEPVALGHFRTLVLDSSIDKRDLWQTTRDLGIAQGREVVCPAARARSRWIKRLFDIFIAVPAAILTAPIVLIAALAIFCIDPGAVFYAQTRVGLDRRAVRIFKLRTMYKDSEARLERILAQNAAAKAEWQRYFKLRDDPRVLPVVGHFLRMSSIDELPQLWNVLRGDISLVGPRPFPAYHLQSFDADFQTMRASVPPGITGLWQVSARSDGDLDVQVQQDTQYIQNWSIWLDTYLMFQTIGAVFAGRGAR